MQLYRGVASGLCDVLLLCVVAGHQLHFDSDDEGQGGVRHPIITAIVYLSDNTSPAQRQPGCRDSNSAAGAGLDSGTVSGCCCGACGAEQAGSCGCVQQEWVGGPTVMTDQVLGGPLATQGWLAHPATNRVVFFDGRYLHGERAVLGRGCWVAAARRLALRTHGECDQGMCWAAGAGVVPGRGSAPSDGRRCTLMMAFWRDLKCRYESGVLHVGFAGLCFVGVVFGRVLYGAHHADTCATAAAVGACRTQPGQGVGACMTMPDPAAVEEKRVWQRELRPLEAAGLVVGSGAATPVQELQHVSAVWQAVDGGGGTAGAAYQCCFQGF